MLIHNDDGKPKQSHKYSWVSANVNKAGTAAATDITSIAAFANIFSNLLRKPHKIKLEAAGTAYFKINGGDVITVTATTPFSAEDLIIDSLYVSDNSANVAVTVYLQ